MADYIPRETAIEIVKNAESQHDALFALRTIPSSAIVRCKDCKWCSTTDCADGFGWCNNQRSPSFDKGVTTNWFCKGGERRGNA